MKQLAVGALKGLDGLMAMRAAEGDDDGFLAQLNKPRPVTARYRAIAADYEPPQGSGLARIARDALFDRVFGRRTERPHRAHVQQLPMERRNRLPDRRSGSCCRPPEVSTIRRSGPRRR